MISEYNLGFSFKASKFPVEKFTKLAFMNNKQSLNDYVNGDLINVDENDNIVFTRLNSKKKLAAKSVGFILSLYLIFFLILFFKGSS